MPQRALTIEEKRLRKRKENQKFFSNPEALKRKREVDRVRKQQRRQEEQARHVNTSAPLAHHTIPDEPFTGFIGNESDGEPAIGYMPEENEKETGAFEPEDGLILRGVSQGHLEEEVRGINV